MVDPLASLYDVQARYPVAISTSDQPRVQQMLVDASAVVRSFTRQQFTWSQSTDRVRPIGHKLILPQKPVVSVDAVAIVDVLQAGNLLPIPLSAWVWDGGQEIWLGQMDVVVNLPEDVLDLYRHNTPLLQVTYTHGYAVVPDDVRAVVCNMVIRTLDLPGVGGAQSQMVGPYSYRLSNTGMDGILALSDSEQKMLTRYRRKGRTVELR